MDSQHHVSVNNGRINSSSCLLLLLFPVVQVPFWTIASQERKESKPRKGAGLPVQVEAVAGPVQVSTQEGWEHPDKALLCVVPGRSSQALSRLAWTDRSIRQDVQQQTESVGRLQQVHRYICSLSPLPLPHSHSSDEFSPSPSLLNIGPAFPQTPELSLRTSTWVHLEPFPTHSSVHRLAFHPLYISHYICPLQ